MSVPRANVFDSRRNRIAYYAGFTATMLGSGLAGPFLAIFLTTQRGIDPITLSLGLALSAGATLLVTPLAGQAAARFGAIRVFGIGVACQSLGTVVFVVSGFAPIVLGGFALFGLASGLAYSVATPAIVQLAGKERLSSIFPTLTVLINVGAAIGAALGGGLVQFLGPDTLPWLVALNAASYLAFGAVVLALGRGLSTPSDASTRPRLRDSVRPFADRRFLVVIALEIMIPLVGFSQFNDVLPLIWFESLGLDGGVIGALFATNAVTIIVSQFVVRRYAREWPFLRSIATALVLWLIAFLLMLFTALSGAGTVAILSLFVFSIFFAIGECFLSVGLQPLIVSRSPDELLPMYSSAATLAYSSALIVGPILGIAVWQGAGFGAYSIFLVAGSLLSAVICLLAMRAAPNGELIHE